MHNNKMRRKLHELGWAWDKEAQEFRKNDTGEGMDDFYVPESGREDWDELSKVVGL